jgi:hypothetical protein
VLRLRWECVEEDKVRKRGAKGKRGAKRQTRRERRSRRAFLCSFLYY